MSAVPHSRLLRKLYPADEAVTERSVALFRLGEMCNNACPMCSNSGRPEAFFIETAELLRRVGFLAASGMRRVVVTGGEPTIHPGFWEVVEALGAAGLAWDINTHGRSFADPEVTRRALAAGLQRAIVSLHSHLPGPSATISGVRERAHHETVDGLRGLVGAGAWVMVNCVITRENLDHLDAYVRWCAEALEGRAAVKLVFPATTGRGGGWEGIQLRLDEVREPLRRAREAAREAGLRLAFESVPSCILGDPRARNVGRSGFGETHYLDDLAGDRLYPIRHIEASLSAYAPACAECRALRRCPGVSEAYLLRHGDGELTPFR